MLLKICSFIFFIPKRKIDKPFVAMIAVKQYPPVNTPFKLTNYVVVFCRNIGSQ